MCTSIAAKLSIFWISVVLCALCGKRLPRAHKRKCHFILSVGSTQIKLLRSSMLIMSIAINETYPCSRIMATRGFEVIVRRVMIEEKDGRRVSVGLKVRL